MLLIGKKARKFGSETEKRSIIPYERRGYEMTTQCLMIPEQMSGVGNTYANASRSDEYNATSHVSDSDSNKESPYRCEFVCEKL
jgi:hypothetical protein